MLPIKLVLKGFRGIKDGQGLDSYTLDLTKYRGAQLVALAGPNGRGKTTVLDNLQPYPILPSRAAKYSLAGFSMYDHILAPEASKELIWEHNGKTYQTLNVWQIAGSRKSAKAYLFEASEDGSWQPVVTASGITSDGKVETYVNALTEILAPAEVYFASVFSAQGRRKLFEYDKGDLKDLLAELLESSAIQEKAQAAGKVVTGLKAAIETVSAQLIDIETCKVDLGGAQERLVAAKAQLAQAQTASIAAYKLAEEAKAAVNARLALKDQHAAVEAQRKTLVQRRDENEALIKERAEARTASVKAHDEAVAQLEKQHADRIKERGTQRAKVNAAIQQRSQVIAQREAIRGAQKQLTVLIENITQAEAQVKVSRKRLEEHRETAAGINLVEAKVVTARGNYTTVREKLQQIKVRAELAQTVPCVGSDMQPKCKLLSDALAARSQLAPAEVELKSAETSGKALAEQKGKLVEKLNALGKADDGLLEADKVLARLIETKTEVEKLAALSTQLDNAEAELAVHREELANLTRQDAAELAQHEAMLKDRGLTREKLLAAPDPALQRAITARDEAVAALAKLPTAVDDGVAAAQAVADKQVMAHTHAVAAVTAATSTVTFAEAKVAALLARIKAVEPAIAQRERIRNELAFWQLLAKGCGRDGLIAMTIDEAGPTLASHANEILLDCYGRRYSLSIATQKERANGDMAETLDILVHDAESDEAKSLKVMSGGQMVWINEALTRAIALYCGQNANTQRNFGATFSDEADGPLDPERKLAFVAMQRVVLKLGGYTQAFLVSQTPEVVAKADAVIMM